MPCLARDVQAVDTEDGMVLLDGRRGRYWQLNRAGAVVLRGILDSRGAEDIARRLVETSDVSMARAAEDAQALLKALRSAGLVVDAG